MKAGYYFFRRKYRRAGRSLRPSGGYTLLYSDDTKRKRPKVELTLDQYTAFDLVFDNRKANKTKWVPCNYVWRLG